MYKTQLRNTYRRSNEVFNEEMNITAENEHMLYIKMAIKNIDFALISVDYILNTQTIDLNIYKDKHTFYIYYIQNLLTACGNIFDILNNQYRLKWRGKTSITPYARSKALQEKCGLNVKEFPLVFQKEARNTNMHSDERYDEYDRRIGDYNIIDENTPHAERWEILNTPHLRTYDKQAQVYITVDSKQRRMEYPLIQLRQELIRLKDILIAHMD